MGKGEGGGKEEEEINFIHFIKQPSFQSIEEREHVDETFIAQYNEINCDIASK